MAVLLLKIALRILVLECTITHVQIVKPGSLNTTLADMLDLKTRSFFFLCVHNFIKEVVTNRVTHARVRNEKRDEDDDNDLIRSFI